ncbi:MAG TPA: PIG-L family deacetylase [Balneolales bacterium]|nr:PIG-L family deacetylase [Balneolales bacterium]
MESPAIFYVPHQDDEILQLGVAIMNHIYQSREVHLVLCTNGNAYNSYAKRVLNGNTVCEWHKTKHQFHLSDEDYIRARNHEFVWSSMCMKVKPENIHFRQYTDGALSVDNAKYIIAEFEKTYPGARHKTMSYTDPHRDHAALGEALYQLYAEKYVNDVRFYIDTMQMDNVDGYYEPLKKEFLPYLRRANNVYKSFVPNNSLYAIGYHSVPAWFKKQFRKPSSKYHKPEDYK